jgi:hypothetical protein
MRRWRSPPGDPGPPDPTRDDRSDRDVLVLQRDGSSAERVTVVEHRPSPVLRWALVGVVAVAALYGLGLVVAGLLSGDEAAPSGAASPTTAPPAGSPTTDAEAAAPAPTAPPSTVARTGFGRSPRLERVDLPARVDLAPPGVYDGLALLGHNQRRQLVSVDLGNGAVTELRMGDGWQFIPQAASSSTVAGFFTFDGTMIAIGADAHHYLLPVTQSDAPEVIAGPGGDGYWIHAVSNGALWRVSDDGTAEGGFRPLERRAEVIGATARGLAVTTADGATRLHDPVAGTPDRLLPGRVLAAGGDRYVSFVCRDTASCGVVTGRVDADDEEAAELAVPADAEGWSISPSGHWLAVRTAGNVDLLDLDRAAVVSSISAAGDFMLSWTADDRLLLRQEDVNRLLVVRPGEEPAAIEPDPLLLHTASPIAVLAG